MQAEMIGSYWECEAVVDGELDYAFTYLVEWSFGECCLLGLVFIF